MGEKLQYKHKISNDNKKTDSRNALIQRGMPWIVTQRIGNPQNMERIRHGALTIQSIPRNDHEHW